jgi:hypothetical protein
VYSVGALSGFLGSTAILGAVSDRMIRRLAGGTIGSSDGTTFSGGLFCNTLKFSDFMMLTGRIVKQQFFIILKFYQHLFCLQEI